MARLLVLWLLNERPMHGYEIKKSLSDAGMRFWFGLEDASIYSVLRTLAKHGYAVASAPEQQGNRPARTRYEITTEGRRHYRQLLEQAYAFVRATGFFFFLWGFTFTPWLWLVGMACLPL